MFSQKTSIPLCEKHKSLHLQKLSQPSVYVKPFSLSSSSPVKVPQLLRANLLTSSYNTLVWDEEENLIFSSG